MIKEENLDLIVGLTSISNLTNELDNYHLEVDPLKNTYEIQASTLPEISGHLLPSKFNYQSHIHDIITPIRVSRSCESCSMFAGNNVFELYRECQCQNPSTYSDLVKQYLIWSHTQDSGSSRKEGTIENPFTASDSSGKNLSSDTQYKAPSGTTWYYIKNSYSLSSVDQVKTSVNFYGPIFGAIVPVGTKIAPSSVKRGSVIQITNLSESNFLSGPTVNLTREGYSKVTVSNVNVTSSSLISTTLKPIQILSGVRNVSDKNSNGIICSLTNGLTVLPNISGKFFGVPGTIIKPLTVDFYGIFEGNPTSWAWNFGDETSNATTKIVTHTYFITGNYTVKFIIEDS